MLRNFTQKNLQLNKIKMLSLNKILFMKLCGNGKNFFLLKNLKHPNS